jgi:hypothetical protein
MVKIRRPYFVVDDHDFLRRDVADRLTFEGIGSQTADAIDASLQAHAVFQDDYFRGGGDSQNRDQAGRKKRLELWHKHWTAPSDGESRR